MKRTLLLALPALALLLAALSWWHNRTSGIAIVALPLASDCQLHQHACQITQDKLSIQLDANPKPIPIAKGIEFTAQLQGISPSRVQLDINGSNMYMGYNRVDLTQYSDGSWQGKSLLAFCTLDEMHWQLTLLIDLPDGRQLQAPFPLITPYKP